MTLMAGFRRMAMFVILIQGVFGVRDSWQKLELSRSQWMKTHAQYQPISVPGAKGIGSKPWPYMPEENAAADVVDDNHSQADQASDIVIQDPRSQDFPDLKSFIAYWRDKIKLLSLSTYVDDEYFTSPRESTSSEFQDSADEFRVDIDDLEQKAESEQSYASDEDVTSSFVDDAASMTNGDDHDDDDQPLYAAESVIGLEVDSNSASDLILDLEAALSDQPWPVPSSTVDDLSDDESVSSPYYPLDSNEFAVDQNEAIAEDLFSHPTDDASPSRLDSNPEQSAVTYDEENLLRWLDDNVYLFLDHGDHASNLLESNDREIVASDFDNLLEAEVLQPKTWPEVSAVEGPEAGLENKDISMKIRDLIDESDAESDPLLDSDVRSEQFASLDAQISESFQSDVVQSSAGGLPSMLATEDSSSSIDYTGESGTQLNILSGTAAYRDEDAPSDLSGKLSELPSEPMGSPVEEPEPTVSSVFENQDIFVEVDRDQVNESEAVFGPMSPLTSHAENEQLAVPHKKTFNESDSIQSDLGQSSGNALIGIKPADDTSSPLNDSTDEAVDGPLALSAQTREGEEPVIELYETQSVGTAETGICLTQHCQKSDDADAMHKSRSPYLDYDLYGYNDDTTDNTRKANEVHALAVSNAAVQTERSDSTQDGYLDLILNFISKWRILIYIAVSILCILVAFVLVRFRQRRKRLAVNELFASMQIPSKYGIDINQIIS